MPNCLFLIFYHILQSEDCPENVMKSGHDLESRPDYTKLFANKRKKQKKPVFKKGIFRF